MKEIIKSILDDPKSFILDCIGGTCLFGSLLMLYIFLACLKP